MRLSDALIRSLQPEAKQRIVPDDALAGFGVRISPQGTKAFVLTFGARRERVTIGRYPLIGLADARAEARRRLAELTLGKHRAPRTRLSGALETFYTTHLQEKCGERTQREIKRLFKRYLKFDCSLEDVSTHTLTGILDKISSPSEKEHFFRAAKTFFRWCVKRKLIPQNPIESLDAPKKGKSRERVLSDDELRAVWKAADTIGYPFGDICKLLILTGMRRNEVASLRAEYIHGDTICLPAEAVKNKKTFTFPIGKLAASTLDMAARKGTSYLFPARGKTNSSFNGFSKSKKSLDASAKISPWVLHDCRRTFCTNLQRLGVRLEVIEALVNHVSGVSKSGVAGIYNRHTWWDEMVEAVARYDDWIRPIIRPDNPEARPDERHAGPDAREARPDY